MIRYELVIALLLAALLITGFTKVFIRYFGDPMSTKIETWTVAESKIGPMLLQAGLLALLMPKMSMYLDRITRAWFLKKHNSRFSILQFCLSPLTLWPFFIIQILILIFGTELFSFFKLQSYFYIWSEQNPIAYFLTDGRFDKIIFLFAAILIFNLFLMVSEWLWVWSLLLFANGVLSLNGTVAIFIAILVAEYMRLVLFAGAKLLNLAASSKLIRENFGALENNDVIKAFRVGSIIMVALLIVDFFAFGYLRDYWAVIGPGAIVASGSMMGDLLIPNRMLMLMLSCAIVLFPSFLGLMTWGHFKAKAVLD